MRVAFPNGLTYTPGQSQTLAITITDAVAATFGFEMSARLESSLTTQAGTFTPGQTQRVICADGQPRPAAGCGGNGLEWVEHTSPYLAGSISVQWTPPATASGNIHIYVSANATNGDNTRLGDHIYATDYVLTPASAATANVPTIKSVVNGASGLAGIQSGSWVQINGTNFAAANTTWDNAITNNVFPTTLGGITVAIDGKPAPIAFVNQTQINVLAPATRTVGDVSVVVSNASGSSAPSTVQMQTTAPGFFTFSQNQGKYIAAVVLESDGSFSYLAPVGLLGSGVKSRPAKAGDTVLLFGTGFGPTTSPLNPEMAASVAIPLAHTTGNITAPLAQVTIGGALATTQFCGIVSPGVYQINIVVPDGVSAGDQAVKMDLLSGPSTTQTVFVAVQ